MPPSPTSRPSQLGADIGVTIAPSPVEYMNLFARAHGSSARESEVLALLGIGLDIRQSRTAVPLGAHGQRR